METEKLYAAQLVPCTCHIVEEILKQQEPEESSNAANQKTTTNIVQIARNTNQSHTQQTKIENSNDSKMLSDELTSSKPIKSIFDLDFDDDDDQLSSIVKDVKIPENSFNSKICFDNVKPNSAESKRFLDIQYQEENEVHDINVAVASSPLFTMYEDPNCPAKQRFNVQTMDVTGFHINSLHNYYIPNINGNWNNIGILSKPYPSISELLATLETYTLSDGADVVPKYGSLTYGRIRKDLSYLTFSKSFKPKMFKSSIAPFLGIAKCLPSCRRAANRRQCSKQRTKSSEYTIIDNPSPLSVDVDISLEDFRNDQLQYGFDQDKYNSVDLLKMSGESIETTETTNRHKETKNSNNSNSCLSLEGKPSPINEKVRSRRTHTQRTLVERNRKKRRKEQTKGQEPREKRVKIALNGNAATQRQILHSRAEGGGHICKEIKYIDKKAKENEYGADMQSELSDTENESSLSRDSEHSNNNSTDIEEEEYAIVQRPLISGNYNNHIVLTIKKTPSKINSPCPRYLESIINPTKYNHSRTINQNNSGSPCGQRNEYIMGVTNEACIKNLHKHSRYRCRRIGHSNRFRHQKFSCQHETIDLELKHIFSNNNLNSRPILKTHQKLFFANELDRVDNSGQKERIINYSSSSDENESESECEFNLEKEEKDFIWSRGQNGGSEHKIRIKIESEATSVAKQDKQTVESYLSSSDASVNTHVSTDNENDAPQVIKTEDLRFINNGMLPSFNSISENRSDNKIICYDHLNVIQSYNIDPCSSFEQNLEYRSGIRTVGNDEPNLSEIKQFREWHEILQLQSYNNEPLVVLPYVVLE